MTNRAFHAQAIPEGLPEWVMLLPAGTIATRDGRGPYVNSNPQGILEMFAAWGMPLLIDYEHQSIDASEKTEPTPAAGWIHELEIRDSGIWGRVEWNARAAELLAAKEYRYLSPHFEYEKKTFVITRILNVGLTNNPNLYLKAAASRGGTMDELIRELCHMLNLPFTSTKEEIVAHLNRLIEMVQGSAAAAQAFAKALGLPETSDLAAVAQAFAARLSAAPDPEKYVAKTEYDRVASSLAQLQATERQKEVERTVCEAMRAGKISPAMKKWATDYCSQNPEGFAEFVKNAAPVVPLGPVAPAVPPKGSGEDPDLEVAVQQLVDQHKKDNPGTSARAAVLAVAKKRPELFRERR